MTPQPLVPPNRVECYLLDNRRARIATTFLLYAVIYGAAMGLLGHSPFQGLISGVIWGAGMTFLVSWVERRQLGVDAGRLETAKRFMADPERAAIDPATALTVLDIDRKDQQFGRRWATLILSSFAIVCIAASVVQWIQGASVVAVGWLLLALIPAAIAVYGERTLAAKVERREYAVSRARDVGSPPVELDTNCFA